MAKGYWVAHVDVRGQQGYDAYSAALAATLRKFGGRFIVRGGKIERMEGSVRSRTVVIEFPDYATALGCYRSSEYAANIAMREGHATVDLIVVEGYDGAQP